MDDKAARSEAEEQAERFISENEPLLEEGGPSALGRVITHGANIATALSNETIQLSDELVAATNELAAAIGDPQTSPSSIDALEKRRAELRPIYDRKAAAFDRFSAFMDRVQAAYHERASTGDES